MAEKKEAIQVLIVEDQFLVAAELEDILARLGHHHIATVSTCEEAIEAVRHQWPDIILMDIFIDGPRDGVETAEEILKLGKVAILFLTDREEDQVYNRAKRIPDAWFLNKPVSGMQLGRTIDQYLEVRSQQGLPQAAPAAVPVARQVSIVIRDGYSKVLIRLEELISLEGSQGRYLNFYTTRREQPYQESNSLSKKLEQLSHHPDGHRLVQVSRSHAVNFDFVDQWEDNCLILKNKQRIRVGGTYLAQVQAFFGE